VGSQGGTAAQDPTVPLGMRLGRSTWLLAAAPARELLRDAAATMVAPGGTAASCCREAGVLGDHVAHCTSHLLVAATGPQLLPQRSYKCMLGLLGPERVACCCRQRVWVVSMCVRASAQLCWRHTCW
jgi:hypothetical protein